MAEGPGAAIVVSWGDLAPRFLNCHHFISSIISSTDSNRRMWEEVSLKWSSNSNPRTAMCETSLSLKIIFTNFAGKKEDERVGLHPKEIKSGKGRALLLPRERTFEETFGGGMGSPQF